MLAADWRPGEEDEMSASVADESAPGLVEPSKMHPHGAPAGDTSSPFASLFSVNLLYLVTLVLGVFVASWLQSWHFVWGLIASELLLILLPTLLFLRLRRTPLRAGLRLKPIRPLIALLCLLLGVATYFVMVVIDAIMVQVTGLGVLPLSADSMPKGALESLGLFLAMVVVAPLCEEPLYRGVIQGTYERERAASFAISITALMFALSHFQLSGLAGLLVASFMLGFVAWRSGSIYASIFAHAGLNGLSAVSLLLTKGLGFLGLPTALIGLVAMTALIFAIRRLQPFEEEPAPVERNGVRRWLWNYWPLMLAGALFLGVAALNVSTSQVTLGQAGYNAVKIEKVLENRFQIKNEAGENVGEMTCTITPQSPNIWLDCAGNIGAYDVETNDGHFSDSDHTVRWTATWNATTMDLLEFSYERAYAEGGNDFRATLKEGRLVVESPAGTQELDVSPADLVDYEWAWRTNALKPQLVRSIQTPYVYLSLWDAEVGAASPALRDETLQLYSAEPITLPAGQLSAQKSTLGGQSAWYAKDHPGPIRLDDGVLIYELEQ
jgi:membrane protease YdiL (CAAX protease family)